MRPNARGYLNYPLDGVLGREANVRVLRCLIAHGGPLSTSGITRRTGITHVTVNNCLRELDVLRITESLGSGQSVLHAARTDHPLTGALVELFAAESRRKSGIFDALGAAVAGEASPLALWIYGSAARGDDRPDSDMDIAAVFKKTLSLQACERLQDSIRFAGDRFGFRPSLIQLSSEDVLQLAIEVDPWWENMEREAKVVIGAHPSELLRSLRRKVRALA